MILARVFFLVLARKVQPIGTLASVVSPLVPVSSVSLCWIPKVSIVLGGCSCAVSLCCVVTLAVLLFCGIFL